MALDVAAIKKDFPILDRVTHDHRLTYLDSANSSQKPRAVIEAMEHFTEHSYANIHRAVYDIAEEATAASPLRAGLQSDGLAHPR